MVIKVEDEGEKKENGKKIIIAPEFSAGSGGVPLRSRDIRGFFQMKITSQNHFNLSCPERRDEADGLLLVAGLSTIYLTGQRNS